MCTFLTLHLSAALAACRSTNLIYMHQSYQQQIYSTFLSINPFLLLSHSLYICMYISSKVDLIECKRLYLSLFVCMYEGTTGCMYTCMHNVCVYVYVCAYLVLRTFFNSTPCGIYAPYIDFITITIIINKP